MNLCQNCGEQIEEIITMDGIVEICLCVSNDLDFEL